MIGKGLRDASLYCVYLLFLFRSVVVFGGGGEEDIAAGVEGGFYAILDYADDKADGYGLHGNVVADIEERTSHGYQQQRTSGYT